MHVKEIEYHNFLNKGPDFEQKSINKNHFKLSFYEFSLRWEIFQEFWCQKGLLLKLQWRLLLSANVMQFFQFIFWNPILSSVISTSFLSASFVKSIFEDYWLDWIHWALSRRPKEEVPWNLPGWSIKNFIEKYHDL